MSENDSARLSRYVEGVFTRSGSTEWPTVRKAARSLGWTLTRVEDAVEGDPDANLFLSSYFAKPEPPLAEHFIERYNTLPAKPYANL
jgi:hypothetical protein